MYEKRDYRDLIKAKDLIPCEIKVETTDLLILTDVSIEGMKDGIIEYIRGLRKQITDYANLEPEFIKSMVPLKGINTKKALIKRMHKASKKAKVGPMAAVAGGISEFVGRYILKEANEVIVENGGDIFISMKREASVMIFSGIKSPFSGMKVKIIKEDMPIGICTSSARIGPSISFGDTDAVCVLAKDVFFADALATRVANIVKNSKDIDYALEYAKTCSELIGIIIIRNEKVGIWGKVELTQ